MRVTRLIPDTEAAKEWLAKRGVHAPVVNGLPNFGWICDTGGVAVGGVVMIPSTDGEDVEIVADGGWTVNAAREVFEAVFMRFGNYRLTSRCLASNVKNLRVLHKFGFKIEGRKRCKDGDYIMLGMLREECNLLRRDN